MPQFNPPPSWPKAPQGWTPPPGWKPPADWAPLPPGWQLWLPDAAPQRSWFARHKILTGAGAVVALLLVIGIAGGGGGSSTPSAGSGAQTSQAASSDTSDKAESGGAAGKPSANAKSETKAKADAAAGLGDAVRDDDLEFKVSKVKCGASKLGNEYFNTKAQGEFCLVNLSVKNTGDQAVSFAGSDQKLFNGKGQEFSADTEAQFYLEDSKGIYEDINPGNKLSGQIVFDVPKGTQPVKLVLHSSSFFSDGAAVALA